MEQHLAAFLAIRHAPGSYYSQQASDSNYFHLQLPTRKSERVHKKAESIVSSFRHGEFRRLFVMSMIATVFMFSLSEKLEALSVSYQTILLTGSDAPIPNQSVMFRSFSNAVLNDSGQLAFNATLTGAGVDRTNDFGTFGHFNGEDSVIARVGDAVPSLEPGVSFRGFGPFGGPVLNDAGQIAFLANLMGTGIDASNDGGYFLQSGGRQALVARTGMPILDIESNVNFGFLYPIALNDSGQMTFHASLSGAGVDDTNDRGIFSATPDALRLIARTGDAVPGAGLGVIFDGLDSPTISDAGQTAFRFFVSGTAVDSASNRGFFAEFNGSLRLLVRRGDSVPTEMPGATFTDITRIARNSLGQTAFHGFFTGSDSLQRGIFIETDDSLKLLVRGGEAAPGTEPGVNLSGFSTSLSISNAGEVAFVGFLSGTTVDFDNREGIFTILGDKFELVARTGNAAPNTELGVEFIDFTSPALNDLGQVAFLAQLTGNGVDSTNDRGIFATDPAGNLKLVAREGDIFDVNPDPFITDYRTISSVRFVNESRGSDGRPRSFNNAGQLAFTTGFTDSTAGLFVATIGVPEPTSLSLFVLGCLMLLHRRQR